MSYKGYEIREFVLHDYEHPQYEIELVAPCGCQACEDQVQPGHTYCETSPEDLRDDEIVSPVYDGEFGWYWAWGGEDYYVDHWEPKENNIYKIVSSGRSERVVRLGDASRKIVLYDIYKNGELFIPRIGTLAYEEWLYDNVEDDDLVQQPAWGEGCWNLMSGKEYREAWLASESERGAA